MNTYQSDPTSETSQEELHLVAGRQTQPVRPPYSNRNRSQTIAQISRVMGDLHALRHKRDAAYDALARAHQETLFRLALVGALRRGEDGQRILRIGALSALLARAAGCEPSWCELICQAAPLHDLGSCASGADAASQPAGESHTRLGAKLLGGTDVPVLKLAAEIAMSHHERWDGSGFPRGLAGTDIPLSGRIVALVDHLDSLPGFNIAPESTSDALLRNRLASSVGNGYDPFLVEKLLEILHSTRLLRAFLASQAITYEDPGWNSDWWTVF